MNKLNDWLAVKITKGMANMFCAYIFLIWSLIPLVFPQAQNIVFYVSGGIIQLVALSLIMVGQNVLGREAEKRDIETHDTVMLEIGLIREQLEIAKIQRTNADIKRQDLKLILEEMNEHFINNQQQ